jgi:hypothetical protein
MDAQSEEDDVAVDLIECNVTSAWPWDRLVDIENELVQGSSGQNRNTENIDECKHYFSCHSCKERADGRIADLSKWYGDIHIEERQFQREFGPTPYFAQRIDCSARSAETYTKDSEASSLSVEEHPPKTVSLSTIARPDRTGMSSYL